MTGRPKESEYAPFYAGYVALVPEDDILTVLEAQRDGVRLVAAAISPQQEAWAYAPGKWTTREVLSHVTDAERVFGYRAFCIGRGEKAALPGFDEKEYALRSDAIGRPGRELAEEFGVVRAGNLLALRRLGADAWLSLGNANGSAVSTRALAYIMAGHVRHHMRVLAERYGVRA